MAEKDYADPVSLLEYDPAGVVIRATGNALILNQLDNFASSLKYYVDMMKRNSMATPPGNTVTNEPQDHRINEEAEGDEEGISSRPDPVASNRTAEVTPVARAARGAVQDPPVESDESDDESDNDSEDDDDDSKHGESYKKTGQSTPDGSSGVGRAQDSGRRSPPSPNDEKTTIPPTIGTTNKPLKAPGGIRDARGRFTSKRAESKRNSKSRQQTADPVCDGGATDPSKAAIQRKRRCKKESEEDSEVANKRQRKQRTNSCTSYASEHEKEEEDSKEEQVVFDRRVQDPKQPTLMEKIKASPLQYSVGVPRKVVSLHFKGLGLSSKCSMKVISKAKDKTCVSHLIFRHGSIDFPFDDRRKKFEWRLVEGEGISSTERRCMSLYLDPSKHTQEELPVFLSSGGSGSGQRYVPNMLYYVGHFLCTSFEKKDHMFEGISRRAILKFKFVGFHKTLAKKMADLA